MRAKWTVAQTILGAADGLETDGEVSDFGGKEHVKLMVTSTGNSEQKAFLKIIRGNASMSTGCF